MSGGGALGLGKSKSQQQAEQQATSMGFSQAQSQDISQSTGSSVSGSSTTQNIAFADLFQQLYGNASGAAGMAAAGAGELSSAAKQLFSGGMDTLSNLGGDVGTDYLTSRLGDDSVLNAQIESLRDESGRLFTEQLNPAITARAVAGGTLGGGRQGITQGQAIGDTQRAFTQGVTQLMTANQNAKDAAASSIASNSLSAASTGLGALPSMLDILTQGNNAELGVYSNLSQILGGPTVLSQSESSGVSTQQALSQAFSSSFGQNTSQSTGTSSGKASGWNFNMSGYGGVGASSGG